jgi:hypothetical protein
MAKRVLVTGAAGKIAGQILPALRERYELTLVDLRATDRSGSSLSGIHQVDLLDSSPNTYRSLFEAQDAVVHFGYVRPSGTTGADRFAAELRNVQMAYNVFRASLEASVGRVVVASSNHAADYYEELILDGVRDTVDPEERALSYGFYGWAKEAYEHLGFVFALGKEFGRPLENVHIRIGGPRETDVSRCALGDLRCMRRALGAYISERDMQQLFVKSVETEDIRNDQGVPFQIFYGISDNSHAFWSIANARRVIGYAPEDNSEIRFRDWIARHIEAHLAEEA